MAAPLLALQVKQPDLDISTPMMRAQQLRSAETQNQLSQLQLESGRARQGALDAFSTARAAGDPRAADALAGQPDLQAQVYQNMNADSERKIRAMGRAAMSVLPLRGKPGFEQAWRSEMDALYRDGVIDEARYKQFRDTPNDLVLDQVITMSSGLDGYLKMRGLETSKTISDAVSRLFGGAGSPRASIDPYQAGLVSLESGGRNVQTELTDASGRPRSSAFGPFQITEGTWAGIVKNNPGSGLTMADWRDPAKQVVGEKLLRAENAQALATANIVPTDRNLRIAHLLGAPDAVKFLTALGRNPDVTVDQTGIDPKAIENNRELFMSPGGRPLPARMAYEAATARLGDGMEGVKALAPQPAAPGSTGTGFNERIAEAAPLLMQMAMMPGVSAEQKQVLLELGKAGIAAGQPTPNEKDYESYARDARARGETPIDRLEWRRAATDKGEDAFSAKRGTQIAESIGAVETRTTASRDLAQNFRNVAQLLANPNVYTGKGAETVQWLKSFASTFLGADVAGVADAEVASKIRTMSLGKIKDLVGDQRMTNEDRQAYMSVIPGLGDDPESIQLMAQFAHQLSLANIAKEMKLNELMTTHEGNARKAWAEFRQWESEQPIWSPELIAQAQLKAKAETIRRGPTAGSEGALDRLFEKYGRDPAASTRPADRSSAPPEEAGIP